MIVQIKAFFSLLLNGSEDSVIFLAVRNPELGHAPDKDPPQMAPCGVKLQVSACPGNSCSLSYDLYI